MTLGQTHSSPPAVQHRPPVPRLLWTPEHGQEPVDREVTARTCHVDRPRGLAGVGKVRVDTNPLVRGRRQQSRGSCREVIRVAAKASGQPDLTRTGQVLAEQHDQLLDRSVAATAILVVQQVEVHSLTPGKTERPHVLGPACGDRNRCRRQARPPVPQAPHRRLRHAGEA
jgi:hypothetical protein